ncbi:MAG: hypothetical protein M2R45_01982 [Verrucomicrobia subdivision 3 bacterium]|nr:hypothetical protein [Limisphaerales bacterium]MCS1416151.1 hypothetical protein [Limisphaerales bacterium]
MRCPRQKGNDRTTTFSKQSQSQISRCLLLRNREWIEFPARKSLFTKQYRKEAVRWIQ